MREWTIYWGQRNFYLQIIPLYAGCAQLTFPALKEVMKIDLCAIACQLEEDNLILLDRDPIISSFITIQMHVYERRAHLIGIRVGEGLI